MGKLEEDEHLYHLTVLWDIRESVRAEKISEEILPVPKFTRILREIPGRLRRWLFGKNRKNAGGNGRKTGRTPTMG